MITNKIIKIVCILILTISLTSCLHNRDMQFEQKYKNSKNKNLNLKNKINKQTKEIASLKNLINKQNEKIAALNKNLTDQQKEENAQQKVTEEKKETLVQKSIAEKTNSYQKKEPPIKDTKKIIVIDSKEKYKKKIVLKKGESPKKIYDKGLELFKKKDYTEAIEYFNQFLEANPPYDLLDNAHFWIGECFYSMHKYQKAILKYKLVQDTYPESNKFPFAILKLGVTNIKIGKKEIGIKYLEYLDKKYKRKSEAIQKARNILKK